VIRTPWWTSYRDRVFDRWFLHVHRLEAALERRILLDVLLIFGEGRRANRAQLPARERRLQHVGGVHRTLGRAGADERVQLVDEEDDRALRLLDLLQDGLQPVLELAPVFRARDHGAQVERDDPLVLEALRDVAHVDAPREPFDDRGLSDAGLADQNRVVLRAAREDLDDPANLLVTADDRVDLPAARQVREVARVALQRLVFVLGVRIRYPRRAADLLQRLEQRVLRCTLRGETLPGRAGGLLGEREKEMLRRDVFVPELLCHLEGPVEDLVEIGRDDGVGGCARHLRTVVELGLDLASEHRRIDPELLEDRDDDALVLPEQREEKMVRGKLGVAARARVALRLLDRFLGLDGELVESHRCLLPMIGG
jgi:hypothetical protein